MTRPIIALLLVAAMAGAAPVPKEAPAERLRRLYGEPKESSGKAVFDLAGNRLAIRSAVALSGFDGPVRTAPRTTRTVTGDFDLVVRLTGPTVPDRDAEYLVPQPSVKAGLYASGEDVAVAFGRQVSRHVDVGRAVSKHLDTSVWLDEVIPNEVHGGRFVLSDTGRPVFLRMTRTGGTLTVMASDDGKAWGDPREPSHVALPEVVAVGVFLSQTVEQKCEAAFDQFTVTQPKK